MSKGNSLHSLGLLFSILATALALDVVRTTTAAAAPRAAAGPPHRGFRPLPTSPSSCGRRPATRRHWHARRA